jgi:hypothetical protein
LSGIATDISENEILLGKLKDISPSVVLVPVAFNVYVFK